MSKLTIKEQIKIILIIAFMAVSYFSFGQDVDPEIPFPKNPNLEFQEGDDELIPVPLYNLRMGNYIYDLYGALYPYCVDIKGELIKSLEIRKEQELINLEQQKKINVLIVGVSSLSVAGIVLVAVLLKGK